ASKIYGKLPEHGDQEQFLKVQEAFPAEAKNCLCQQVFTDSSFAAGLELPGEAGVEAYFAAMFPPPREDTAQLAEATDRRYHWWARLLATCTTFALFGIVTLLIPENRQNLPGPLAVIGTLAVLFLLLSSIMAILTSWLTSLIGRWHASVRR